MSNKAYYYLVAGLPDITFNEKRGAEDLRPALDEAQQRVDAQDRDAVMAIRYAFDNENVLQHLFPTTHERFNALGTFSAQYLQQELKHPDTLPDYLVSFVRDYQAGTMPHGLQSWQDCLMWYFYEEMCSHPHPFVRQWYTFELHLRNVLAALNARAFPKGARSKFTGYSVEHAVLGNDEIATQLKKSSAQDFGLSAVLPWIETVLAFPQQLDQREERIDTFRWDTAGGLSEHTVFGIEIILGFIIKLGIIKRWQNLDTPRGKEMLESLTERLSSEFSLPKDIE
jgi:hypothetical protein